MRKGCIESDLPIILHPESVAPEQPLKWSAGDNALLFRQLTAIITSGSLALLTPKNTRVRYFICGIATKFLRN
ncbi:hypothetical protein SY86_08005 [Erwinia tracheiphila]|uniref:Uncharacterized protein n=1 Tax=Erwinia tracheiphila TaxID=65700 RepID=A0A0M2K8W0_9GAMM|nr:hypothetical protein [Erwinia tracheiphila]EOS96053.1 hypothetical protein ETR_05073 [Erwinia tracheiphila PSU-1]AXF76734.1 hypothetical protein AV903_12925 [Erwinia tracheiphila]KKF35374.1 hypothetical protein SY86_08005 [Erwinia tracheiphila]UIA84589.1 hypothetical protein LU604_06370 [Erwinia tracheiphila]UIA93181.1 hypothetical protein LU632_06355 [Erwinia tracheiphila]